MKKKILSTILIIAMMLTTILPVTTFASRNPSSWAVEEVSMAINEGLVTESVMVDYQADITREQFCEMVVRAYERISGEHAKKGNIYFSDTNNVEILKAANLGIVTGYGDNVFGPNDLITREQIATMLVRMIDKSVSYANIDVYNTNYFKDEYDISDWAIASVNFAYDEGIMQGVGDSCIDPQANTTCEQAVLLVYRTVDKYINLEDASDIILLVTDAYNEKIGEGHFVIPQFNFKSSDCERINAEIWDKLYNNFVSELKPEYVFPGDCIQYEWIIVNEVMSLMINNTQEGLSKTDYYVYNIDVSDGTSLNNEAVASSLGFTVDEYKKRAREALGSYFWSGRDRDDENFYNQSFVDRFNTCLKNTLDDENIDDTIAYINMEGQLSMLAKVYSMAGADYYWVNFNLCDYQLLPYYAEEASLLTK